MRSPITGPVCWSRRPILGTGFGVGLAHAGPGGDLVLRSEASWRTVSGVYINTAAGVVWLYFRRWPR